MAFTQSGYFRAIGIGVPPAYQQETDKGFLVVYSHSTFADAFGQVPVVERGDLPHILALADHEPLFARLRAYNRTGRPSYPVEAMWRAALTKYLLGLRYYAELVNLLSTNTAAWQLCGFEEGVPNASVICRFFKRLSNHPDLIEQAIDRLVCNVAQAVREHKDASAPPFTTSTQRSTCVTC